MGAWTWRAYDLRTGVALGDLPLTDWSHTDTLNDSGDFSATLSAVDAAMVRDVLGATVVAQSVIVPVRDGNPLGFAGIVWRSDPPSIAGSGLLSYLDAQALTVTKTYTNVDQHLLIKDLVDWVATAAGGDIKLDTSQVTTSGVLRTQTWSVYEAKNIGEAIRQKADNIQGYDVDFRVEFDAGVLKRRMRMWTPRRGTPYIDQSSPVFTFDGTRGNILSLPSVPRDATEMVTQVIALGEETDPTNHVRRWANSYRADLVALGWPRLVHVLDLPDIKNDTSLQEHADGYAHFYGAVLVDQLVMDVNPNHEMWGWGTWDLGDDCRVIIPAGAHPWWPDGFNQIRRITSHQWTVNGDGERLQVSTGRLT